jgi:lysozyme
MTRTELFEAIRPFAPDHRFSTIQVTAIDSVADLLGLPRVDPEVRRCSNAGLAIIKRSEGLRLTAYQDTGGVWTIGYGHTGPDVHQGLTITEARADELLRADIMEAEGDVRRLCPVTTQNQFDALVSFTFNLGGGQLEKSTLRRLHNEGKYAEAQGQFGRWINDNGRELPGLVTRRADEAELYGRQS